MSVRSEAAKLRWHDCDDIASNMMRVLGIAATKQQIHDYVYTELKSRGLVPGALAGDEPALREVWLKGESVHSCLQGRGYTCRPAASRDVVHQKTGLAGAGYAGTQGGNYGTGRIESRTKDPGDLTPGVWNRDPRFRTLAQTMC